MKNTLFFFPKPLFVPIANNFSLYIYNLSYLLLSFTKYKYTVYTGMYFHQNTSYQTQSFPYPTTTQWWNRAKRRRSARDPRPQVLPSHADPSPPSVDSSNPMNNSKYLLAPWNTWRRKQNRKESNTTSKPKVPEFLRGIKHQTNIVENSQFYKNFQKVSTKGGKCTSTPPEPYTENPQYSDKNATGSLPLKTQIQCSGPPRPYIHPINHRAQNLGPKITPWNVTSQVYTWKHFPNLPCLHQKTWPPNLSGSHKTSQITPTRSASEKLALTQTKLLVTCPAD